MNLFTSNIPNIQQQIKDLIESTKNENEKRKIIFELFQFLGTLQEEHGMAQLDNKIYSDNIIQSLSKGDLRLFRSIDYQYNFLIFLVKNYSEDSELNEYIDGFVEQFKHEFTAKDIEITATGATRCKTNIRFAVNDLRDLGLIGSRDRYGRRTLRPTFLGLLLIYFLHHDEFHQQELEERLHKTPKSLIHKTSPKNRYGASGKYDTNLTNGIRQLNAIDNQQRVLNNLGDQFFKKEIDDGVENKFKNILTEYNNYVFKSKNHSEDPAIIKTKVGKQALQIINRFEEEIEYDKLFGDLLGLVRKAIQ